MIGPDSEFWLFVVPLHVGFTAVGLVVLSTAFPEHLYPVGSLGYLATGAVGVLALGGLGWHVAEEPLPIPDHDGDKSE